MAHLVFLFARCSASAVPGFDKSPEGTVAERLQAAPAGRRSVAGETPGASSGLPWPRP
ncbi:Uncharacterized protein PPKH_0638 [Pseudomonas putida]|nr:Uncharacterized protein PPKH_0638 [Pseudomonas putida]